MALLECPYSGKHTSDHIAARLSAFELTILLVMGIIAFSSEAQAQSFGDWSAHEIKDPMNPSRYYIETKSRNELDEGLLTKGRLTLRYFCSDERIAVGSSKLQFRSKHERSTSTSGRIRVDDAESTGLLFSIFGEKDTWITPATMPDRDVYAKEIFEGDNRVLIEVRITGSSQDTQIARFSLKGASEGLQWCESKTNN